MSEVMAPQAPPGGWLARYGPVVGSGTLRALEALARRL